MAEELGIKIYGTSHSAAVVTGIKDLIGNIEGGSWSDLEGSGFVSCRNSIVQGSPIG
ncbi:MAG: hypothetical protein HOM44_13640 [Gammaproteobacteria bacterium]|nr:hypothetical protein [Gammaproteobacteria bacterium]